MERLYDMDIFEIERVDVLKDASATAILETVQLMA